MYLEYLNIRLQDEEKPIRLFENNVVEITIISTQYWTYKFVLVLIIDVFLDI